MKLLSLSLEGQEDHTKNGIVIHLNELIHGELVLRFLSRWWPKVFGVGFCFPYTEPRLLRIKCHPTMLVELAQKAVTFLDKCTCQPRSLSVEHSNLFAALLVVLKGATAES